MISSILKYLVTSTIVLLPFTSCVFASTSNGVTTVPGKGPEMSGIAYFFNNYPLSSTNTVYNDSGSSTSADGWVSTLGSNNRLIQYKVGNPAGTVTMSYYGKVASDVSESLIVEIITNATSTGFVNIVEKIDQMRMAIKITTNTANISGTGRFTGITFAP